MSAAADEAKPTEAVINTCVKITMSVKGCGDDHISPCESNFCYPTYDFKLTDLGPMRMSEADAAPTLASSPVKKSKGKHEKGAKKKRRHVDSV